MAFNDNELPLLKEDNLSESVQNFPVLYGKFKKGVKERDSVKNHGQKIFSNIGMMHIFI